MIAALLAASLGLTAPDCPPEHAKMGHCTPDQPAAPKAEAPKRPDDPDCPPEHAAMGHCTPAKPVEPVAAAPAATGTALDAGNGPAPTPVAAAYADRIWGADAMRGPRDAMIREHGGGSFSKVTVDLAELRVTDDHTAGHWEADAWFGGDIDRLALKTEGAATIGEGVENVELTALYSRAVGPYFNLQAGIRQDVGPGPDRTHAVIGIEGLAPYWFEVDAYAWLSTKGELRASASAEFDQRITQRLILQPRAEFDLSAQDIPELGMGHGLTSGEIGLRLRYEIIREFAPYIGVVHERSFGRTARFARAAGNDPASTSFVIGIRAWF